jgi:hypothetical protein
MATKSRSQRTGGQAQDTVERIRELNERILGNARQAGNTYLDAYERALSTIVEYQESAAKSAPVDWMTSVLEAQANFTREFGNLYASTARETLQKK